MTFGGYYSGINTGTYYGSGTNSTSNITKTASSINVNRIARDIASGYSADIQVIQKYLNSGNKAQGMELYSELVDDVKETAKSYNYELSDGQIQSILDEAYLNQTGQTFVDSATNNTHSPFVTGLLEGIPLIGWFGANSFSDAEALAKVSDTEVRWVDKCMEYVGSAVSGVVPGAGLAVAVEVIKGAKIGSVGGVVGICLGAIAGLAVGCIANHLKAYTDSNP